MEQSTKAMIVQFFSEPLSEGWVYPCSTDELRKALETLPSQDTEGIKTVGLYRSTNRDNNANARYVFGAEAKIKIYSWKSDLRLRLPAHTKQHEAERYFDIEFEYGMRLETSGRRMTCCWEAEPLRHFILEYVLAHEVGHHVYYRQRIDSNLQFHPVTSESEKFAEAYARRYIRS